MNSFTLDHSCLVTLSMRDQGAEAVRSLTEASRRDELRGHVTACGSTAALVAAGYPASYREFGDWLRLYRADHLAQAYPIMRWGPAFWNAGIWGDDAAYARERTIFEMLHPAGIYEWEDAASAAGVDVDVRAGEVYDEWRDAILEAQAVWAHERCGARVYLTADAALEHRLREVDLGVRVLSPREACETMLGDG